MPTYVYEDEKGNKFDVKQNIKEVALTTLAQVLEQLGEPVSPTDKIMRVKRVLSAPLNRWRFLD